MSKQIDLQGGSVLIGVPGVVYSVAVEFKKTMSGVVKFNLITVDHPDEKFNMFHDTVYAEMPDEDGPPSRFIKFYGKSNLYPKDSEKAKELILNRERYDNIKHLEYYLFNLNEWDFNSIMRRKENAGS